MGTRLPDRRCEMRALVRLVALAMLLAGVALIARAYQVEARMHLNRTLTLFSEDA